MASGRVFMAVLAAGSSRRFGEADKLAVLFRGKLLGEHVCVNAPVDRIADGCAFVITSQFDHPCAPAWRAAGFDIAINTRASQGMGTSVAEAARLALRAECDALLIALADTPLVPCEHFEALIDAYTSADDLVCSFDGGVRLPPAIFGKNRIEALTTLTGDTGARALLKEARTITCPPDWLVDIDTPEALVRLS